MTTLHPPPARAARTDVNPELAHDHARDGKFFLVLRRDPRFTERAAAVRTGGRQQRLVAFIDATRSSSMGLGTIPRTGCPTRSPRMRLQRFREGRGLAMRPTLRVCQLALHALQFTTEPVVLPLDPIAFPLRAFRSLTEFVDFTLSRIVVARRWLRHA